MSTIRKAVIAAAGQGTRMYPITKAIDKAMPLLTARGWNDKASALSEVSGVSVLTFIEQDPEKAYGTACSRDDGQGVHVDDAVMAGSCCHGRKLTLNWNAR